MNFTGKTILITGASSGIGSELAKQLAMENCRLALLARRKNILDKIVEELSDTGSEFLTVECDVSNKISVTGAFNNVKEKFGNIDIAILNAGVSFRGSANKFDSANAEKTFNTNVLGILYCIEQLVGDFMKRKDGMIVGVSSLADARGFPKSGFYSGSKAAATLLLESLRIEMRKYNVKVITVKPGFVKTPMTDKNEFYMPFLMDVTKAAKIIIKGIKKEKRVIEFPFLTALGSKLLKLIPNFIFDFLAYRHLQSLSEKK